MLKVPINKPFINEKELEVVRAILLSGKLSSSKNEGGQHVQEFESAFTSYVRAKYAVAVNSGTSALQAALYTLDIKKGDEILLPSFAFVGTTNSVVSTGAKPVFVDILKQNYTMDPLVLLGNPYEVYFNEEKILKHEFLTNETHVWLNFRPETSGTINIIGSTVIPEFPFFMPLALGIALILGIQLKNKLTLR